MVPIRTYSNWNSRPSDSMEAIEPYRRYYFICEGRNTERWYFEKLIDIRKSLSIHALLDISYLEKTGEHENLSNPRQLIEFANEQKDNGEIKFDKNFDKMIIVFDADVFETQLNDYDEVRSLGEQNNILGVTNPSFELFLLLHYDDSVDEIILPNSENIIKNDWVGTTKNNRKRHIAHIFQQKSGLKSKENSAVGELAHKVHIAIAQEKKLNNNIQSCKGVLTSNIGCIIQAIIDDQCDD